MTETVEILQNKDTYAQENDGFITASKVKCFLNNPEEYFLKYVKKIPYEASEKEHFKHGTMIDDYITLVDPATGDESKFLEKYFLDDGAIKEVLEQRYAAKKINELGENATPDEKIVTSNKAFAELKGKKKEEIQVMLYGDVTKKIRLTAGEVELLYGVINEFKRQPLFDYEGVYEKQKEVIGEFEGNNGYKLKLRGKLDRFKSEDKTKATIRDTKTTGNIFKFPLQAYNDLGYDVSMSFYWVLVQVSLGLDSDLVLDVCQKTGNYASRFYVIPPQIVRSTIENKIIPALNQLCEFHKLYDETKDENIWKVKRPFESYYNCDLYKYMDTTICEKIEELQ